MIDNWAQVKASFKTMLDTTIGGYSESGVVDISKKSANPASLSNKTYSIMSKGCPPLGQYVNAEIDFIYDVRLQVCFEINERDQKVSYDAAIAAAEVIVKTRIDTSMWGDLITIFHQGTSELLPVGTLQGHSFSYITIDFQVTGRDFIPT